MSATNWLIVIVLAAVVGTIGWLNIKADMEVCETYYPQLSLASCMVSRKTVALPQGQPR